MAPLLRASFFGLRCSRLVPSPSLSSQRELLKPPESCFILWRWYGESAALEETCSLTQTNTAGESRAVIQGEDSSKVVDAQGSLKETPAANAVNQECAAKEPSFTANTDKLASEIIGKLRLKNNLNGSKDNGVVTSQKAFTSSKGNKPPEGSIREDKFKQVVNSMRKLAAKRNANLASGGAMSDFAKTEEGEIQDDFADLDLPQGQGEAVPSKGSNNSESFSPKEGGLQGPNAKQKDNRFQGNQQKAKDVSFSFLKSLDATATTSGVAECDSFFNSNASNLKDSVRSTLQMSIDFLKSGRAKNEPSHEARSASSHEVKSVSSHEAKDISYHESKRASMERMASHEARNASSHEVKSVSSHEAKDISYHEPKRALIEWMERDATPCNANESTNRTTYPGYTVCIRNLPSHSNLALVKESLSLHGEVISSFKKSNSDGSCNAYVEFKTADAMDGALASRWVMLDSKAFSIVRADIPITTVVRLSKVSAETTGPQLVSVCEKFGGLDNIRKRANGSYDVYYKANELSNMLTILDSLNEVTLNQSRLVALPAPLLHPAMRKEVLKRSEGQAWHASQLSQMLNRIEGGLDLVSVCFEDLKTLTAMEDEMTK